MKWEEADANREHRKAEVREFLTEAGLVEVVDAVRSVFGAGVRIDWAKHGEKILGRAAYEESMREAARHKRRVEQWESRKKTSCTTWRKSTD